MRTDYFLKLIKKRLTFSHSLHFEKGSKENVKKIDLSQEN
jgi:hypothetical protein